MNDANGVQIVDRRKQLHKIQKRFSAPQSTFLLDEMKKFSLCRILHDDGLLAIVHGQNVYDARNVSVAESSQDG